MGAGNASNGNSNEKKRQIQLDPESDSRKEVRTPRPTPRSPLSSPPPAAEAARRSQQFEKEKPPPDEVEEESSDDHKVEFIKFEISEMKRALEAMNENIQRIEDERSALRQRFVHMTPEDQEIFIKSVYDEFSENYDSHMRDTGHYGAIERLIDKELAAHHFLFPIMDLSVGTGVPFVHFLRRLNEQLVRECKSPKYIIPLDELRAHHLQSIYANDLSDKMTAKAEKRVVELARELCSQINETRPACDGMHKRPPIITTDDEWVAFRNYSFRDLKFRALKKRIGTILISQTFHIVTPYDKDQLAKAINWALAPGGRVIIIEEFAWRARTNPSQSPSAVLKLVEMIASPLQKKSELISLFKDSDKKPYEMVSRSIERIDFENRDHEMTLTILQKPGNSGNEQMKFFL